MIQKKIKDMDLAQIADSGQCFRMERLGAGYYSLVAFGKYLEIHQEGEEFLFSCTEEEFGEVWAEYFDLETDYGKIKDSVDEEDSYLKAAVAYGHGIRILRQDLWEMIISFLISQNNNISRIRNSVALLCKRVGEEKKGINGVVYYTFPQADAIVQAGMEILGTLGLGYRDKYIFKIAQAAEEGSLDLESLGHRDYETAHRELMSQYGIGRKVADCICLFGLYHTEAFPLDTHVKKIVEAHYPQGFPAGRYQGYAGILQQYMFYYDLQKISVSSKRGE